MRLGEVIANAARIVRGSPETEITRIVYDSRQAGPGALFCAVGGVKADGAAYVAQALANGAAAVLAGRELPGEFPLVVAADPRRAMALVAAHFHKLPASRLTMLGVTGTNGKTTTAYLVEAMVRAAGRRSGLIGTVEQRYTGVVKPASHTTPESVDLQALLADMVRVQTDVVAMEVSSHALAQSRVVGIRYRAAAFTNLTRDHLDYHGSMDEYFEAKAQLFTEHLASQGTAVVNAQDEGGAKLVDRLRGGPRSVWRFGVNDASLQISAEDPKLRLAGFEATLRTPIGTREISSPMVGLHNVQNALTAAGLALAGGIPIGAVVEALRTSTGAPGRLERVPDAGGRLVFVDYAHSDDALARVLEALHAVSPEGTRFVTIFGCGGDRDRGKRPLMGRAAASRSDVAIATSDNPRTENPEAILDEIVPGIEAAGLVGSTEAELAKGARGYLRITDRAEAIACGARLARPGDVILIAGKGHEDYQIIGTEKRHFDDREIARAALAEVRS